MIIERQKDFGSLLENLQSDERPKPVKESFDGAPDAEALLKEAESGKPLTLMVYMCGSNLESDPQGSASRDIREMVAEMVSTYHPDGMYGTDTNDPMYQKLVDVEDE